MALSQREKRLLLVPVVLGGVIAFYTLVHEPLFTRKAEAAQNSQKVATELKRDQTKLAKEGNLPVRKEAVAAREKVVDSWVPGKNSAAMLIWYLSQAEMQTGARIKGITVGERKQVSVGEATPAKGAAPQPPAAQGEQGGSSNPQAPAAKNPDAIAPTLMVVQIELKADAMFLQHLHFNKALEEMPLFLNTDSLALAPRTQNDAQLVGMLVQSGNAELAAQLLGASPGLEGTYRISLYFKGEKMGPATTDMQFAEDTGRMDPFAMDAVEEFIQVLQKFYADQGRTNGAGGPGGQGGSNGQGGQMQYPVVPGPKQQQMG